MALENDEADGVRDVSSERPGEGIGGEACELLPLRFDLEVHPVEVLDRRLHSVRRLEHTRIRFGSLFRAELAAVHSRFTGLRFPDNVCHALIVRGSRRLSGVDKSGKSVRDLQLFLPAVAQHPVGGGALGEDHAGLPPMFGRPAGDLDASADGQGGLGG